MNPLIEASSPLEIASLWRLDLLNGGDVQSICLRWLQEGREDEECGIARLAGETGLTLTDAKPTFERILLRTVGRPVERDEAILRALLIHLTVALEGDLRGGVEHLIRQFEYSDLSERRLVRHPRRAEDRPNDAYAAEALGLEYVYGSFDEFDHLGSFPSEQRESVEGKMQSDLRGAVIELKEHLTSLLEG